MLKKEKGVSTRELIINQSLRLMNEIGFVNFRIDTLAKALDLSPGNITYHFAKKEDLCHYHWIMFHNELDSLSRLFTKSLDIKQTFLIIRAISALIYKYRGIVIYRGSDNVTHEQDDEGRYSFKTKMDLLFELLLGQLTENDYLITESTTNQQQLCRNIFLINLRYGINREYMLSEEEVAGNADYNALIILYASFYCLFNEAGRAEFDLIKEQIEKRTQEEQNTEMI